MKNIIKLGLSHLGVLALIAYLQKIVKKMTGNAKFITLADQTTALDTAVAALETANTNYEAAKSTAEQLLTVRDNAVVAAENAAQALAGGAEGVTKDPADLQSGGWIWPPLTAPRWGRCWLRPTLAPPAGTPWFGGHRLRHAEGSPDAYRRTCDELDGPFTQFYLGKKSSCTKTGLVSGSANWFRMAAVGAPGKARMPARS